MKRDLQFCRYKELADGYIEEASRELTSPSDRLLEAVRYSLLSGGKRLRPIIFLAAYDLCAMGNNASADEEYVKKNLCFAIEALHTYTLIHDDLPCMDNDSERRGKPANHIVFGEAHALLAGDALLNASIEHALLAAVDKKRVDAIRYFFNQTGMGAIIGGQANELSISEPKKNADTIKFTDIERDLHIIQCKTAALFKASAVMGAICGSAAAKNSKNSRKKIELFEQFGLNFGMAFQMRDDINDNDAASFAQKYGTERADLFLREFAINAKLASQQLNSDFLASLCDSLHD